MGENFNYVKSFPLTGGAQYTLALDAGGILWQDDVVNNPGVLAEIFNGIIAGSYMFSATMDDVEYMCLSDLATGTDIPRQYNPQPATGGMTFDRISQVGPGAPPTFQTTTSNSAATQAVITAWSAAGGIVSFTTVNSFTAGEIVTLSAFGTSTFFNGRTFAVLGTGLSGAGFQISFAGTSGGSDTGLATSQYGYNIQGITQAPAASDLGDPGHFQILLWSEGPTSKTPGNVLTVFYTNQFSFPNGQDPNLIIGGFVYLICPFITGTFVVTSVGGAYPPGAASPRFYFTVQMPSVNFQYFTITDQAVGTYQVTLATMTVQQPISNVSVGDEITISGASPGGWNSTWTITALLNSGIYTITSTQLTGGIATYGWNWAGAGTPIPPVAGQLVTIIGTTNGNLIFNGVDLLIASVTGGPNSGTFTIGNVTGPNIGSAAETGQAETSGTSFQFDPGQKTVGSSQNPIIGNAAANTGIVTIVGANTAVGAGTRQAVVFFETRNGLKTACSAPVTFSTTQAANYILATNIPIGPPDVIRRWIAFTVAGANGIPGPYFYAIDTPVSYTLNNQNYLYTATYVDDNLSTTAKFIFTDAVLQSGEEIDVQGNNLFSQIELGSSAWTIAYAERMFYGLEQNKVLNFNNLSFDGGYLPNVGGPLQPLGWGIDVLSNLNIGFTGMGAGLVVSPVFGDAYYIPNQGSVLLATLGMIIQGAYQDAYNVPIILPNTQYSVRVTVSIPSGNTTGNLVIDLASQNSGLISGSATSGGYTPPFGQFILPFAQMTTEPLIYSGTLLVNPFTMGVPTGLLLRVYTTGIAAGADVLIDRLEIFPTAQPTLTTNIRVSYADNFEAFDGVTGNLGLASHNTQTCYGAFILHDQLFFLQSGSMQSTQDIPGVEPNAPGGGWALHEVSNRVGTCGIHAYDYGEEWMVTACRNGVYGFNGGQPMRIDYQQKEIWEQINWAAGNTIVVRNDLPNRRIYAAVPLPTPNQWLPLAPVNPAPTSPNVIMMWNYQGLGSFEAMVSSPEVHTTMFGTLAALDMRLKCSLWNITTPYMGFITQPDLTTASLEICNGVGSGKIYKLDPNQLSDDGSAINSVYVTYGFVNSAKAATAPLLGMHRKRYQMLQQYVQGSGRMSVQIFPNWILNPKMLVFNPYAYTVPGGINLQAEPPDDITRPLNIGANRAFVKWALNQVGGYFKLSKCVLVGTVDPYSVVNPNAG